MGRGSPAHKQKFVEEGFEFNTATELRMKKEKEKLHPNKDK